MNLKEQVKTKAIEIKFKTKEKLEQFGAYLNEHEEMGKLVVYGLVGVIGGIVTGISTISNVASGSPTNTLPSCRVEDEITGLEFRTKRPLTNEQIIELGDRMIDGQTKGDALNEMGMLKKERKRR